MEFGFPMKNKKEPSVEAISFEILNSPVLLN